MPHRPRSIVITTIWDKSIKYECYEIYLDSRTSKWKKSQLIFVGENTVNLTLHLEYLTEWSKTDGNQFYNPFLSIIIFLSSFVHEVILYWSGLFGFSRQFRNIADDNIRDWGSKRKLPQYNEMHIEKNSYTLA